MTRKLVTRYTGDKGTAHKRIAKGTIEARPDSVFMVYTTGLNKGYALEVLLSELKYRGKPVTQLDEIDFMSADL